MQSADWLCKTLSFSILRVEHDFAKNPLCNELIR